MILYYCPRVPFKSAGVRVLHRHVEILNRHGFDAAILHDVTGFKFDDMPDVPIRTMGSPVTRRDIMVVPEGIPSLMAQASAGRIRLVVIAMSWWYVYQHLQDDQDWKQFDVERVITNCPFIADFLAWAMKIPVQLFQSGINPSLYFPESKEKTIVYISRKQGEIPELRRLLACRDRRFVEQIAWKGLDGLSEAAYAKEIRRASIFLNLSPQEGFCLPIFEAMRSGTLVAGYHGVGSHRELVGSGEKQNCILAENLDYITLARRIEPLLMDVLSGDMDGWDRVSKNACLTASPFTPEAEEHLVLEMWKNICA